MRKPSLAILAALLLLPFTFAPSAQARAADPLVLAWMGDGKPLSDQALGGMLKEMTQAEAHPDQIVFLVHGYSDTRKDSEQIYRAVSGLIDKSFRERHQRVLIVGVQWHASLPGSSIPWREMSTYLKGVTESRAVGHVPMRQLVYGLRQQYPQVPMSMLTQSLGCEVAVACAYPDLKYADTLARARPFSPASSPQGGAPLTFDTIVLAQADLDYDVWYKSRVQLFLPQPVAKMLWITVAPYVTAVTTPWTAARWCGANPPPRAFRG